VGDLVNKRKGEFLLQGNEANARGKRQAAANVLDSSGLFGFFRGRKARLRGSRLLSFEEGERDPDPRLRRPVSISLRKKGGRRK